MKPVSYHIFAYWHDPRWELFVGASVKIRDLAMNLAHEGNDVRLFLPKYGFSKMRLPFTVTEIPLINLPGLRSISYNAFLLFFLLKHWASLRPDIIYLRRTSLIVPLLYARGKGARFFFEVNDDPFVNQPEEESSGGRRLRAFISEILDRLNLSNADRCFVISQGLIEKIIGRMPNVGADKMLVMSSGANTDLMRPMDKETACKKTGLDSNKRYIGFVGSLLSHQGLFHLIEAMPFVIETEPAAQCLIVGEGPLKKNLQEKVAQKNLARFFVFAGEVGYDSLPAWINAMDVCVAPYTSNSGLRSPVKIFDCLACGRPVVASDVPGVTGVFKTAPLLRLISPESPEVLGIAVSEILSAPAPAEVERTEAHQWIKKRFDRRIMAKRVSDEAEKLLES